MPTGLYMREVEGKPGKVYYPLENRTFQSPKPKENQVVVKITAAALNHRDLFARQKLYPAIAFEVPMLADGCGVVISTGSSQEAKRWLNKRVVISPCTGWKDDPDGPEDPAGIRILGGTKLNPNGTAVTEMIIEAAELEEAPEHLDSAEAAAVPLAGLTGWRATHVKAAAAMKPGCNVLITGIGGGVAIMALLFAVGAGANVYVSSGNEDKIKKATQLGAKGGINYKDKSWDKKLIEMLPKDNKKLDAIIDGAGGDIVEKSPKLLRAGGIISSYGMTLGPKMPISMSAVMKNIEVRGSTMGSRKEFTDMINFVKQRKLKPLVSKVAKGIDNIPEIDGLFDDMNKGSQLGKLVIQISNEREAKL